jgi:hypothetical protein
VTVRVSQVLSALAARKPLEVRSAAAAWGVLPNLLTYA